MIPKKIHYCWFGKNKKPASVNKCLASWKKYCPDYEIIEWNEDNFDLDEYPYLRWCHDNKKWAFLSDFARLLIIKKNGGIYFDTDVELLKKPDELLKYGAFYGFENKRNVATGLGFGATANHYTVIEMIKEYEMLKIDEEGNYPLIVCPALNTKALVKCGLQLTGETQNIGDIVIFSTEFFNPYDDPTGRLNITKNTYSIHWYSKSWMNRSTILRSKLTKPFHRFLGEDCFDWLKNKK